MKTSILHLIGLFLVLAFTASCGKKSEGGGSSNSNNPLTVGTTDHTALVNWLNTADTSSNIRAYYVKKTTSMSGFSVETLVCNPNGGNLICTKPTQCLESSIIAGNNFTEFGTTTFNNLSPNGCPLSGTFYTKANDTALRESILGKMGRFVLTNRTIKVENLYTVFYSASSDSTVVTGSAKINTSLPAPLNPIILEENGQRTKTYYTF